MAEEVQKEYMDWAKFDSDISDFIVYLDQYGFNSEDSVILGLKRGGFPTATALSNKTNIPVSTVAFQTRDGDDVTPNFLEGELIKKAKKIIIPDDIYDTGLTIETTVKHLIEDFGIDIENIVGLFHYGSDKMSETTLKYYRCMASNEGKWVVFPFE